MNRGSRRARRGRNLLRHALLPSGAFYAGIVVAVMLTPSNDPTPSGPLSAPQSEPRTYADDLRRQISASEVSEPLRSLVDAGPGTFDVATGGAAGGRGPQTIAYRVEVEQGVPETPDDFADAVDDTLRHDRGWLRTGRYTFRRTTTGPLRVILATPKTTDALCAPLETQGKVSCRNGDLVVINARRWFDGAASYGDDLENYRRYVINHEVGHSFGLGHQACTGPGRAAPVMLQQTLGLQGCTPNPWP